MAMYGKFVMVSTPEDVKTVFTAEPDVLYAGRANRDLEPFVGSKSLLRLDSKEHLRHRRLLLPPFHGQRMRSYARVMDAATREAIDRMPVGGSFSAHEHMQAITLAVIVRAVFGIDDEGEQRAMTAALLEMLDPPSPVLMFLLPQVELPGTPYARFVARRARVDAMLYALIRERKARAARGEAAGDDILSLMLAARDEDGQPLSDKELRDELVTLLIAGHETTATALSWAIERVLRTPRVREKLQRELDNCDGSPESFAALPYLERVIKESLRVRPILPDVVREVMKGPFRVGGYDIPEGIRVSPCIILAHRDAAQFEDPLAFDPDRWERAKPDPYAWFPFGGGVRRCIGMAFAQYEMQIVLGRLLRDVRFELVHDRDHKVERRTITLCPEGGTPLRRIQ
jgi:cytochrome P450